MSLARPAYLLTVRALVQFPRIPSVLVFSMIPPLIQLLIFGSVFERLTEFPNFPTDNYYEYLAPAIVMFTTIIGIANAGVALVTDFQNRYFMKLLVAPINFWSILLGRLLSDGARVYVQAGIILAISLLFKARVETGLLGALLMLLVATLFSIVTVGVLVANVALATKNTSSVQAIFPIFFILMFLTTAFMPKDNIDSSILKTIIDWNPAEYIVRAMRDLMLTGYEAENLGIAFGIIAGFGLLGVALTRLNYGSVYK